MGNPHIPYHAHVARGPQKKANGRGSVSIQDVASSAGVSIATVSRVLNTPGLVSEGTAKRVREAVSSLGYVPNAFAQALIKRSSHVLAVALPDIHGEF